jgi:GNAT superfamily N-acetyltransferase
MTGLEHLPTSATGTGWERTPWHATQRAAWEALKEGRELTPEVRQIRANEGLKLRALRLRALADAPTAFGSTLAQEEKFPERVWHERAESGAVGADRVTFVAEQEGQWIGIATGLARDPEEPNDPQPWLVGMFVAPEARRSGVGVALVEAVVRWARERRANSLSLWVTSTNSPAIALYEKCGFRRTEETKPVTRFSSLTESRMVSDLR